MCSGRGRRQPSAAATPVHTVRNPSTVRALMMQYLFLRNNPWLRLAVPKTHAPKDGNGDLESTVSKAAIFALGIG